MVRYSLDCWDTTCYAFGGLNIMPEKLAKAFRAEGITATLGKIALHPKLLSLSAIGV